MNIRIERDGRVDLDIEHVASEVDKTLNEEYVATVTVIRTEIKDKDIRENEDELFIEENGSDTFGGLIKDIESGNGATVDIQVESFERYARDTIPTGPEISYNSANDSDIIKDAIDRVDELEPGNIQTLNNEISIEFNHSSPARMIRRVRELTGGEVSYNPDKTVDYIEEIGSNRTNITLSPNNQNITNISVRRMGGDSNITHLRMLGSGSGSNQLVAEVVSEDYEEGERKIWDTYTDSSVDDTTTLRSEGESRMKEMTESQIDIDATIRGPDINIGDRFTITYEPENIFQEQLRTAEVVEKVDFNGRRYDCSFSTRALTRETEDQKLHKDVQKTNRESGAEAGLPIYASTDTAPQRLGVIFVTGEQDEDPRGIYIYDDEEEKYKRGSNANISELSDRDLRGTNITDNGNVVYDGSAGGIQSGAISDPLGSIGNYPLEHGEDVDAPANAHHSSPMAHAGIISPDPDKSTGYYQFIETGFRPNYIEFITTSHFGDLGEELVYDEVDLDRINHCISKGYAYGINEDQQFVTNIVWSPGLAEANRTYSNKGEVVNSVFMQESPDEQLVKQESIATLFSLSDNGFRLQWLSNDIESNIIYKAFR